MVAGRLSDEERSELEAIRRRADRNAHGHISYALRLQLWDDVATFTTAIGGAIITAVIAYLIGADQPHVMAEIAAAGIGAGITFVGVWQAIWQPAKRSRNHQVWSTKFFAIEDKCRLGLSGVTMPDISGLMQELLEVVDNAELIPQRRWDRHRSRSLQASSKGS